MNLPQKLNEAYWIYLLICVFKIARWLKPAWNILDRSHVLILLAVEKDLSPVALVAGLTWINLQTTTTLSINCHSLGCTPWTSLKMSGKQRKGTTRTRTWNVLNWATREVTLTLPWNFNGKSSTSLEVSSPLAALRSSLQICIHLKGRLIETFLYRWY